MNLCDIAAEHGLGTFVCENTIKTLTQTGVSGTEYTYDLELQDGTLGTFTRDGSDIIDISLSSVPNDATPITFILYNIIRILNEQDNNNAALDAATNAISAQFAAENARDTILNMLVATGIAGSNATWNGTTLTIPRGNTGADGIQGIQGVKGSDGDNVDHITRTAGTGTPGETNVYTMWQDAGEIISLGTFSIYNGADGASGVDGDNVDHISLTSGNGAAGTTDVYTMWQDIGEIISIGTFSVNHGFDGAGAGDLIAANNLSDLNDIPTAKVNLGLDKALNTLNKLDAIIAPGVGNDFTEGYSIGSRWADILANEEYVCLDIAADAAVWKQTTGASTPQLPSPVLTGVSTGVELANDIIITDTAYDASYTYVVGVNFGSVIDNSDGTYTVTLPDYSVSTSIALTLDASKAGYLDSQGTHGIAVTNTITTTPILTGNASGTESTVLVVTRTNYSATATYTLSVTGGTIVDNGSTIDWTLPTFTGVNDDYILTDYAQEPSDIISLVATHTVSVTESTTSIADQTILYENVTISVTEFPVITNVDLTGSTILATADTANATSSIVEQDAVDLDFINATPTVDNTAVNYTIDLATNLSITLSGQNLTDGDTVLLNDGVSTTLVEFDTTGVYTDNLDGTYTIDITTASLTNAPTTVAKNTASVSTSIVATGGTDDFVVRTAQSHTADGDGDASVTAFNPTTTGSDVVLSNGNSTVTDASSDNANSNAYSDTQVISGNVYTEFTVDVKITAQHFGIATVDTYQTSNASATTTGWSWITSGAPYIQTNAVSTVYGALVSAGDIVGIRYSYDTGELEFYLNGVSQGIAFTLPINTAVYFYTLVTDGDQNTVNFGATALTYQPAGTTTLAYDNTATKITDVFDTDTRSGRDIKHKVDLAQSGDEVTKISTVVQKVG